MYGKLNDEIIAGEIVLELIVYAMKMVVVSLNSFVQCDLVGRSRILHQDSALIIRAISNLLFVTDNSSWSFCIFSLSTFNFAYIHPLILIVFVQRYVISVERF